MKVVHLVSGEDGGAAIAAKRLDDALNKNGVNSNVAYLNGNIKVCNSKSFILLQKMTRKINIIVAKMFGLKKSSTFAWEGFGLNWSKSKIIAEADVVHLHQVNFGLINWRVLKELSKSKYIVWTQHDMWCFTGGCFYEHCEQQYKNGCMSCPLFNNKAGKMLVRSQFRIKEGILTDYPITIVGCSKWMTENAKASKIAAKCRCVTIPNCIDLNIFYPNRTDHLLNKFPRLKGKKIVLFGAMNAQDTRKGYRYLRNSILGLNPDQYAVVVFGTTTPDQTLSDYTQICLGHISDPKEMCNIYSGADVFVAPSLQENLANTVMESLACGTPVVAFNIGGMPDMIIHEHNGYLAKAGDTEDLRNGIEFCCKVSSIGSNARKYVEDNFHPDIIAKKYLDLYMREA